MPAPLGTGTVAEAQVQAIGVNDQDAGASPESTAARSTGKRRMSNLAVFAIVAKLQLTRMMQASLVRSVAFAAFAEDPHAFKGHPANGSLTWDMLEAAEGNSVVELVEFFRKKLHEPHVPANVRAEVEALVGHRHVVSHPATLKAEEWRDKRMQEFEAAGRRYESRVPLIWNLQQALNRELVSEGSTPIPDFYVTAEMVDLLRTLLKARLTPENAERIPEDAVLAMRLQESRDMTLKHCQDRANGLPPPPRRETKLDRMWAALMRGEDPDAVE